MYAPEHRATQSICVAMRGITKRFGAVLANDNVDLDLMEGEIHAVVGENGAGKSTLMSVLHGMARPDDGQIFVDGLERSFASPRDAIELGIGMVHQHFMLAPSLTAAENIVLGYEPGSAIGASARDVRRLAAELIQRFDLAVPLHRAVRDIPIGAQQRVEILKALHRGARILILDEPTAVLSPKEVEILFERLRLLRDSGITIVFISHKLREVTAISDRTTVMRQGRAVATLSTAATTHEDLAGLMVGAPVVLQRELSARKGTQGSAILSLCGVTTPTRIGQVGLQQIDLDVRAGEIVGVAAIEGNGQSDLLEVAAGVVKPSAGSVILQGKDVTEVDIGRRREMGLGYVPEDRHRDAIALESSAIENFLSVERPRGWRAWLKPAVSGRDRRRVAGHMRDFDVRPPDPEITCGAISGGNQQKLVFARELHREPECLILGQPTRGIDIGASQALFRRIGAARERGAGVLLVSADLDELFSIADRIVVLYEGCITAELDPATATPKDAGVFMTGSSHAA
jgi:general nucleoside transport system ATP-binding protein